MIFTGVIALNPVFENIPIAIAQTMNIITSYSIQSKTTLFDTMLINGKRGSARTMVYMMNVVGVLCSLFNMTSLDSRIKNTTHDGIVHR